MEKTDVQNQWEDEKILRDYLAIERTKLANQRTLLSFFRTSLYLVVTAVAVIKLEMLQDLRFTAWILIAGSIAIMATGLVSFFSMRKKIKNYYQEK